MSAFRNELLREIFQTNRRSWHLENDANGDADFFFSRTVAPLRQLRDEGVIADLFEAQLYSGGRSCIGRVVIRGPVKLET